MEPDAFRRFSTDVAAVAARICAATGTPITAQEWARHVGGPPYDPPC